MSIQWFPGHMHLTRKAIAERVKAIDVVIEMLDARLPGSSANPLLADLTGHKPTLKVLNKQDMADPARTEQWLAHYRAQPGTRAIPLDASHSSPARALVAECRELAPLRGGMVKPLMYGDAAKKYASTAATISASTCASSATSARPVTSMSKCVRVIGSVFTNALAGRRDARSFSS